MKNKGLELDSRLARVHMKARKSRIKQFAGCLGLMSLLPGLAMGASPTEVTVEKPWVRYLLPSTPAAIYLTLTNSTDAPAVLLGASSASCSSLMLHESMSMGGTTVMMEVSSIPVPAHGTVSLTEGSYHLMCMDPKMQVSGTIKMTLDFQDGSSLPVTAPVYGPAGPR